MHWQLLKLDEIGFSAGFILYIAYGTLASFVSYHLVF